MKKILFFSIISFFKINAQNLYFPWQFNAGLNAIIYRHPTEIQDNILDFKNANLGGNLSISKHFYKGISPEISFNIGSVSSYPSSNSTKSLVANGFFNLKYSFSNDYLLSSSSIIEPFIKAGIGQTYQNIIGNKFFTTFGLGGGVNIWVNKNRNLGIQLQQIYNIIPQIKYNNEDYFNYTASLSYRFGKKDIDNDGIRDAIDICPNEFGLKSLNGCPDKDKDCIADIEDKCPNEYGLFEMQGCSDTDNDKIPNNQDKCPNIKGDLSALGCPDKNGDGIDDSNDRCPTIKGLLKFGGCIDTDGDNIPDIDDKCVKTYGLEYLKGCPDSDGDSIPDIDDKCPNEKGSIFSDGCPEVKIEQNLNNLNIVSNPNNTITITSNSNTSSINNFDLNSLFQVRTIFFKSNKFDIYNESYIVLDEIVRVFKATEFRDAYIVEGHTDNSGLKKKNIILSKIRASVIKDYLVKNGVPHYKLHTVASGSKFPIADNKTLEGRALNRRVEVYLK